MKDFESDFEKSNREFDEAFKKQVRFKNIMSVVILILIIIFAIIALVKS